MLNRNVAGGLLLAALSCLFVLQNNANCFLPGHHGFLSSHGLALSANLSAEHPLLMFNSVRRRSDGSIVFDVYNRFPAGAFLAVKLATASVQESLSLQIFVAHQLMNLFLAGAAIAAFLSLCRCGADPGIALGATLLSFASYFCLYYGDMVFNDVPALFGMMLTFHGLVVFVQERTVRQLLVKVGIALALGWQVYALLAPFIILSLCQRDSPRRPLLVIGSFALAAGIFLLAYNVANEASVYGGPLTRLPSVRGAVRRLPFGATDEEEPPGARQPFGTFARVQLTRIGQMCLPHALASPRPDETSQAWFGATALAGALAAAARSQSRTVALSLALSGPCWALPMRRFVLVHDFQSIFFIGVSLSFWCGLGSLAYAAWRPAVILFGCAGVILFSRSAARVNLQKSDLSFDGNMLTADFQRIAKRVGVGRFVYADGSLERMGGAQHAASFYLAGNIFDDRPERSDYVIREGKLDGLETLTPDNRHVFLYVGGKFPAALEVLRRESRTP